MVNDSSFPTPIDAFQVMMDGGNKNRVLVELVKRASADGHIYGIVIEDLHLSEVALAVHFKLTEGMEPNRRDKQLIARCLRLLGDQVQMIGVSVPVVGFISVDKSLEGTVRSEILRNIRKWEGDQDWHHGDFILICLTGEDEEGQMSLFLNGMGDFPNWPNLEIKPMDEVGFQRRLRNQWDEDWPQEYKELWQAIEMAVDTHSTDGLDEWFNNCLAEAARQTEKKGGDPGGE